MAPEKRCYYDILEIPRDAEDKTIKKAHRKLVLKYHPDKNFGDEDAAKEFRLVQEAYECLSDPSERKWYDEHRESILRGGHGFGGDEAYQGEGFIFDVTPYHFAGCYDGYGDGEGGFFDVYSKVFESIIEGEIKGWVSEGNIDEQKMPNIHLKDVSFVSNTFASFFLSSN
jgi:DnaJ family protein A protein 5